MREVTRWHLVMVMDDLGTLNLVGTLSGLTDSSSTAGGIIWAELNAFACLNLRSLDVACRGHCHEILLVLALDTALI